ncbi:MAG: hypothetical protein V7K90_04450 [Nostoc sp.]
MQLEGAKGVKALIPKYTDAVLIFPILEAATDIDTVEDSGQLLHIL